MTFICKIILLCLLPYTFGEFYKTIWTRNGLIRGKSIRSYGSQRGHAFLGIPYARPPLGKLRFKSPLPASSWTGTLDATKYKSACLSDPKRTYKGKDGPVSEDCLYLNVFTTSICLKKGNCSVMAVIHGGTFTFESPTVYKEEIIVNNFANEERNIVVVTLAFRQGTLGWFNIAPGKNSSAHVLNSQQEFVESCGRVNTSGGGGKCTWLEMMI